MRRRALLGALGTTMLAGCSALGNGDTATPVSSTPDGAASWPRTTFGTNNRNANPSVTLPDSAPTDEWETPVRNPGELLVVDNQVFLSDGTDLLALDAETGAERWRRSVRSGTFTPSIGGESILVPGEGKVTAHALSDGTRKWTGAVPGPNGGTPSVMAPPVVVAERVLAAGEGVIACFDGEGERQWWTSPDEPFEGIVHPVGGVDRGVYVAANGATCGFHARPQKRGELDPQAVHRWRVATGTPRSGPIAGERMIFQLADVSDDDANPETVVIALDGASGEEEWRRPLGIGRMFDPAFVERTLFVPDAANRLHVIGADDGEQRGQLRLGDASSPAQTCVAGGANGVVAAPGTGGLVCFDADGSERWRIDGPPHDSVALTERGVFATTAGDERAASADAGTVRRYRFP